MANEKRQKSMMGNILLLLAGAVWGCGLVAQKAGTMYMDPWWFTGIRCILGSAALFPVVIISQRLKSPEQRAAEAEKYNRKTTITAAVVCGILITILIQLTQIGVAYTSVGKAGFITALYILIIPIMGIFLGKKAGPKIWIGVVLALVGLYLLSLTGGIKNINFGDMMMLFAALGCSVHLHALDYFVQRVDPIKLTCYQFAVVACICCVVGLILEPLSWEAVKGCAVPLLYAGLASCGIGYTFQSVGQKYVEANKACLLMSLETVFTLLAGMVFFHEILTGREYLGCALMFAAIIISQLPDRQRAQNPDGSLLGTDE